jgi:ATP-dependent Lon protease
VRKLRGGDPHGPILCFVGPPGTGKTSLGSAIATSIGRAFYRIAVGGVRDEAEIRGHRRTYVGAMPGLLIQALRRVGVRDPVMMIDEIDKMAGGGASGDPTAAMLEVLDPSQNHDFVDHYLNLQFDLSSVLFICTANNLFDIPRPLRDRLEVIRIAGYTVEEKVEIAWRYMLPQLLTDHGISNTDIQFTDEVLGFISSRYSREAGLRNFERNLSAIMRKRARAKAEGEEGRVDHRQRQGRGDPRRASLCGGGGREGAGGWRGDRPGVDVDGRRHHEHRGAADAGLRQAHRHRAAGRRHARIGRCRVFIRSVALREPRREREGVQGNGPAHPLPAGSVPKDGPSAGVAVTLAIASVLSRRKVRRDVAMTGEVTLRGKILEIGGVKEKTLAAYRAGLREVILPKGNFKDLRDIPEEIKQHMAFTFVSTMDEVLQHTLLPKVVPGADQSEPAAVEGAARATPTSTPTVSPAPARPSPA